MRDGKCKQTFSGHEHDINSVQYFPNGMAFGMLLALSLPSANLQPVLRPPVAEPCVWD